MTMSDLYRVTKLRLVNFHNLGTTTLELKGGGHLFLLGDNGSGKTTVLDAIHFVLCGGKEMEFNAAARVVSAARREGRNVQGIIMRYNIETNGPLNPDGGITYAALELVTPKGRKLALAVGAAARSLEERYESWGIIREGGVDELPLTVSAGERFRPSTRQEVREKLANRGYYSRIGAYQDELTTRFFGDRNTYTEFVQLLRTGKAYREIAARASDYDRLFRTLLQKPQRDVFETLINSLKSLEESRQTLDGLQQRARFIDTLMSRQTSIAEQRIRVFCANWQLLTLAINTYRDDSATATQHLQSEEQRLHDLEVNGERLKHAMDLEQLRLTELQQKDAHGLVVRESETRLTCEKHRSELRRAREALTASTRAREEAEKQHRQTLQTTQKELKNLATQVRRHGQHSPFSLSDVAAQLDDSARTETPFALLKELQIVDLQMGADKHSATLNRQAAIAEERSGALEREIAAQTQTIERLQQQEEAEPNLPDFAAARRDLAEAMLTAQPLYEGLVPAATLRDREVAMLEQAIGAQTLATWIVHPESADAARRLLFRKYPTHTLAVPDQQDDTRLDWLARYFDISASDPDALLVLRQQIVAKQGPRAERFLEEQIIHFRNCETPFTLTQPQLIGAEARQQALAQQIRALERERLALQTQLREQQQLLTNLQERQQHLSAIKELLYHLPETLRDLTDKLNRAHAQVEVCRQQCEQIGERLNRSEEELTIATARLEDLTLKIKAEGLEGLDGRIKESQRKYHRQQRELESCHQEMGRVRQQIDNLQDSIARYSREEAATLQSRQDVEGELLRMLDPQPPELNAFVRQHCGRQADDRDALQTLIDNANIKAVQQATEVQHALRQSENLVFGFVYESVANTLLDRRGSTIDVVSREAHQQLAEQESIITEETRRLFRQIIMDELVTTLQTDVMRLEQMARKINRLLRDKPFGNNHYSFAIAPAEGYREIIECVRNYHSLAPEESETTLQNFIATHREQILTTEVGVIPQVLDYRNWFRYELKIMTTSEEGRLIDRRVKSLGSGGEQAVPNYLLILMVANFLYDRDRIRLPVLIFDEAFYGIDAHRRDQILTFATGLKLQLFIASPEQDGVKRDIPLSTSVLVIKDSNFDVHLHTIHWDNRLSQRNLFDSSDDQSKPQPLEFT